MPRGAFYPAPSPWNSAVAAAKANQRPRRGLSPATVQMLQELEAQAEDAYAILRAADQRDKSELRREWIMAREQLERARYRAAKEAARR